MESVWQTSLDMLNAALGDPCTSSVLVYTKEVQPSSFVTVKVIKYLPGFLYQCVGLCKVELVPSPKFQFQYTSFVLS